MQRTCAMTDQKKAVIWEQWRKGIPMNLIAKSIRKPPATVFSYLRYHGGMQPPPRTRSSRQLSLNEREEISRGLATGLSMRSIALMLERSPSTICREIQRNGGRSKYRATIADQSAWRRGKRPKPCVLKTNVALKNIVIQKLTLNWSPEQISAWLIVKYPDDETLRVSHETIYKTLFIQTRGLFRKDLRNHLRTKRKFRHSKRHRPGSRHSLVDAISISERPPEIEDRAIPGQWEGDLIQGSNNSFIATVVERQTRFAVLVKVDGKGSTEVISRLSRKMEKLPDLLKKSLTWDRGTEMTNHREFTVATNMQVFFCDPSSPWQRGTNENTNGLLRQYFPKGTSVARYSQADLDAVAAELNSRPRKTLGFVTPADKLAELLQ
jgi:IS30 family transposase